MQQRFPALTHVDMCLENDLFNPFYDFGLEYETQALPEPFLGGSVPRPKHLNSENFPFPGLPKLLFSATRLVELHPVETRGDGRLPLHVEEAQVTVDKIWMDSTSPCT
jgi:hypothetical protein